MIALKIFKKKRFLIPFTFVLIISIFNFFKHPSVFYLPFNLPGKQRAATIPPLGIFIESQYQNENHSAPCSLINHEMIHWEQYKRMGLFTFYYKYLTLYIQFGRINNWMEEEARKPCNQKQL